MGVRRAKRVLAETVRRLSRILPVTMSWVYYPLVFNRFGSGSVLERPTVLAQPHCISIGNGTSVRRGVRLEAVVRPDFAMPEITIGHRCLIEQNVQIIAKDHISIGNNVSIAGHCAIVDVIHPFTASGDQNIGFRIDDAVTSVQIEDGCFVGFGSVILPGVHLGPGCIVGANSVVTRSFGPRSVVCGAPARLIRTY